MTKTVALCLVLLTGLCAAARAKGGGGPPEEQVAALTQALDRSIQGDTRARLKECLKVAGSGHDSELAADSIRFSCSEQQVVVTDAQLRAAGIVILPREVTGGDVGLARGVDLRRVGNAIGAARTEILDDVTFDSASLRWAVDAYLRGLNRELRSERIGDFLKTLPR